MNDDYFFFNGDMVWVTDTIERGYLDGLIDSQQKYVIIVENEEQSFAFVTWGASANKMINQIKEKGTCAVQLRINVSEYKGLLHTLPHCADITRRKKGE